RREAFLIPLLALLAGDIAMGLLGGDWSLAFHDTMPVVYVSFVLVVCLGRWLRARRSVARIAGATVAASVLFFVLTNFGVWALGSLYPKTWEGLVACYVAAIPFFHHTLLGDAFYVALLFGGLAVFERRWPALREPAPA
ncbi:MAG: hypothetical protein NZM12_12535, partial [Steroidobacteraceae bacterium]|nr:hypothetical protein [Steroidobacteraceae bacterium]MDW8258693.1 DUF6580 family putative transport protein [Gammaproteobacteria bacterium]